MKRGKIYEVFKIYDDEAFRFLCTTKSPNDKDFKCWRKRIDGEFEYQIPSPSAGEAYLFGKEVTKEEYDAFKP